MMFGLKRRHRCIVCNAYRNSDNFAHTYKGIGICKECLKVERTEGDRSFPATSPVDYIIAPYKYQNKIKKALKVYKFSGQKAYGNVFSKLLAEEIGQSELLSGFDMIIPVPLHQSRLIERGFNQSEILCQGLSADLGLPCITDALFRIRNTKRQSELSASERIENVKSAFWASDKVVSGKNIILVDDIYTMGQTMKACAIALKEAGAGRVVGVALCKTFFGD